MKKYHDSILHVQKDAQLTMILQQHLSQWPKILFGKNPIDAGLTFEQCIAKLLAANPELSLPADEVPEFMDTFFHQTAPKPHENQRTIL